MATARALTRRSAEIGACGLDALIVLLQNRTRPLLAEHEAVDDVTTRTAGIPLDMSHPAGEVATEGARR